jgi:hypothetical protein
MAATAWTLYDLAKHRICNNTITLSGGDFRMVLFKGQAAASVSLSTITLLGELGNECSGGAYVAGGKAAGTVRWTVGASAGEQKWDLSSDVVFTATGTNIGSVQYAVMAFSTTAVLTSGYPLCWSKLSTSAFDVTTGNTLTVQINANGVFTLA